MFNNRSWLISWGVAISLRVQAAAAQDVVGPIVGTVESQLYTHTLKPASKPESAPTAVSQGPFDTLIDRSNILGQWNHVAFTFDSKSLTLFLNGKRIADHTLPIAGPASEFGGLAIGGHRAGVGRNFDGLIDEVSVWQRVLDEAELRAMTKERESEMR